MKTCVKCDVSKPVEEFYKNKTTRDGLSVYCKSCMTTYNRERRALWSPERREHQRQARREWGERNPRDPMQTNAERHGLTVEQYLQMLDDQDYECGACGASLETTLQACIDHDHDHCPGPNGCRKCVRGILCQHCNRALGQLGDCPYRVLELYDYLMSGRLKLNGKLSDRKSEWLTK